MTSDHFLMVVCALVLVVIMCSLPSFLLSNFQTIILPLKKKKIALRNISNRLEVVSMALQVTTINIQNEIHSPYFLLSVDRA